MSTAPVTAPLRARPAGPTVVVGWALALVAVSLAGGLASDTGSSWYEGLDLPPFQPPGPVFGIVWTVLYVLIAVAGITATRATAGTAAFRPVHLLFAVNLVLNVAWSWIFFQGHAPVLAGIEVVVLLATTVTLAARLRGPAPRAALLLVPYALWVSFATVLTWTIALTN